jgi:Zn-dependent peptidase ImmA (M78 family)
MLKKIQQVREHYKQYVLDGHGVPISIEDLRWVVNDMYNVDVSIYEVDYEGQFSRGLVERYERSARILIRGKMEKKFRRFVAAKEISHIIIDEREDWSPAGDETIRSAIRERISLSDLENMSPSTVSENYALAASIEILYPLEYRHEDKNRLETGELTLDKLSDYYEVPLFAIELSLRDAYLKTVKELLELSEKTS